MISYRGSEKYPPEEEYKDFIETDLKIGFGQKPVQFCDGLDVFKKVYEKFSLKKEKVSITGHSLGGGIAQYVALMVDKEKGFIPYTCTWNAVGINRDKIINILDFFNYKRIINNLKLENVEKMYFIKFENEYLNFFLKELKKSKIIKDKNNLLKNMNRRYPIVIDESFIKSFLRNTNFNKILEKLSSSTRERLLLNNFVYNVLFKVEDLSKELFIASYFIKKIIKNKIYEEKIVNFCHSNDLTVSLFQHIGAVY